MMMVNDVAGSTPDERYGYIRAIATSRYIHVVGDLRAIACWGLGLIWGDAKDIHHPLSTFATRV